MNELELKKAAKEITETLAGRKISLVFNHGKYILCAVVPLKGELRRTDYTV